MTSPESTGLRPFRWLLYILLLSGWLVTAACEGDQGPPGKDGTDLTPPLGADDDLPGVNVEIVSVTGGSAGGSSFRPGDTITVDFKLTQDDGTPITIDTLDRGSIYVSGPTFNYQRVLPSRSDVKDVAMDVGNGVYRYRYPVPIPAVFDEPINYDPADADGALAGEALLDGTYTVAMECRRIFTIDGESYRDVGNASEYFLMQGATVVAPREVVTLANCNSCHGELSFHGGNRNDVDNCLMCHTAGAKDEDGVSIEFKVMIHKIHTGKHLASVLGVTTDTGGARNYAATPKPYVVGGHDYSEIAFPVWPSLASPMPRDSGYTMLTSGQRALEDSMRSGPVACDKCHGDPDGTGPLPPPVTGDLIYSQPSRRACGSCHDDWVWDQPYTSNGQTMPSQPNDSICNQCHIVEGTPLAVRDAHLHPMVDPTVATGLAIDLTAVDEAGVADMDGTLDPGEKVRLSFRIVDGAGANVPVGEISRFDAVMSGPSTSPNLLHYTSLPTAAVGSGPDYTMLLPERVYYERAGESTAATGESFTTSRLPHWNVATAETAVLLRTASGNSSTLAAAAPSAQNFLDVQSGDGALFARNNFIVVEDGVVGQEEYFQIQFVDGDRLWLSSPATPAYRPNVGVNHPSAAEVRVVTLTAKVEGVDYNLDAAGGVITEIGDMGSGRVIVWSTTDFVVPSTYRGPLNDSPDLAGNAGDWTGLPVVSGTYRVGLYAQRSFTVTRFGEPTSYSDASKPSPVDVLVGDATTIEPNERISSSANCYACHNDISFHGGGRRGYETCTLCHGVAGAEDRPRYVAANAPETEGVMIDFRSMLHKIHHGRDLAEGADYVVVGFGSGYPNNFAAHTYETVGFPTLPGHTQNCQSCHGAENTSWQLPTDREHPSGLSGPSSSWAIACGSCHDDGAASAHIEVNTGASGAESCAICHGEGKAQAVERMHKVR